MRTLQIAMGLALPLDAVTQKFAFIGRSGSGKTYAAMKTAEEMLDAGAQIVVLDPVGAWWGLRICADGGDGFSIPVFGGEHGDIPLAPDAGELVADTIVDREISAILDVSNFTQAEMKRFLTAFAERFFHRKKVARGPVHLFLEEAQTFCPQRVQKGEERMLGAFERIGKVGRNYGIGLTLISQRPQSIHKDVLNHDSRRDRSGAARIALCARRERRGDACSVGEGLERPIRALVDRARRRRLEGRQVPVCDR